LASLLLNFDLLDQLLDPEDHSSDDPHRIYGKEFCLWILRHLTLSQIARDQEKSLSLVEDKSVIGGPQDLSGVLIGDDVVFVGTNEIGPLHPQVTKPDSELRSLLLSRDLDESS